MTKLPNNGELRLQHIRDLEFCCYFDADKPDLVHQVSLLAFPKRIPEPNWAFLLWNQFQETGGVGHPFREVARFDISLDDFGGGEDGAKIAKKMGEIWIEFTSHRHRGDTMLTCPMITLPESALADLSTT